MIILQKVLLKHSSVIQLISNSCQIVQLLSKFRRVVVDFFFCFPIIDLFSNCCRILFKLISNSVQIFSPNLNQLMSNSVEMLSKFNRFNVELSNCCRNLIQLMSKCLSFIEILSSLCRIPSKYCRNSIELMSNSVELLSKFNRVDV